MADARRLRRLEQLILQAVAPLVSHRLKDPRLRLVTVTRVRLSADLGLARVNWSCLGTDADRSRAAHGLESARGPLQSAVGRSLQTRVLPRLEFHYDESAQKAIEIHRILDRLAAERGAREAEGEGTESGPSPPLRA
ncbi:MAG: 30S ribosome-binding factor RbfA [Planctomycetota bacterium]